MAEQTKTWIEESMEKIAAGKNCSVIGKYVCLGFDTFGPFKLVGGLQKGHPTEDEIQKAVEFYQNLIAIK